MVSALLEGLRGISLADLDALAALQTRTDRKYVVPTTIVDGLLEEFSTTVSVLDVGGRRSADYESVYFDTPDLALYVAAARKRPHRFKVRTRLYPDEAAAVLEVKQKTGRGQTLKQRHHTRVVDPRRLSAEDRRFVDDVVGRPGVSDSLHATLTTAYRRTTLVDPAARTRLTFDEGLACTDADGRGIRLEAVVIESKSMGGPSAFDRWLWRNGFRPEPISKYCVGLAVLRPELPSNAWHRTIGRHFRGPAVPAGGGHDARR